MDTLLSAATPEGLAFTLRPAGPFLRGAAFLIDTSIQGLAFLVVIGIAAASLGKFSWFYLLLGFLLQWFYFAAFEMILGGRTPGKLITGLETVRSDGSPLDASAALLRNLLRGADVFFFAFGVGLAVMVFSRGFRRLGDLAAGTLVVYRPGAAVRRAAAGRFEVEALEPPRRLDPEESLALLSFAQRSPRMPPARAAELARRALSALGDAAGASSADPAARLCAYAAWAAGRRP